MVEKRKGSEELGSSGSEELGDSSCKRRRAGASSEMVESEKRKASEELGASEMGKVSASSSCKRRKNELPGDVAEKLLLSPSLSVKKVISLMVVSKQWYNIIRSRDFIKPPFVRSMLMLGGLYRPDRIDLFDPNRPFVWAQRNQPLSDFYVTNCGQGLIVLTNLKGRIKLCNPFIWRYLDLPTPNPIPNPSPVPPNYVFGIGYDTVSNVHKILRFYVADESQSVQIFRLDTFSWDVIPYNGPLVRPNTQVDKDGRSFWIGEDVKGTLMLVRFDPVNEVLTSYEVVVPGMLDNDSWYEARKYLFLFQDSLVLVHEFSYDGEEDDDIIRYRVWRINENGGNQLQPMFAFEHHKDALPLGFCVNDTRLLLMEISSGNVIEFNLIDGTKPVIGRFGADSVFAYPNPVESLALLHQTTEAKQYET